MTGHNLKRHGFRVLEEGGGGLEGERKWVGVGGGREMENLQTHVLIAVIRE